MSDRWIVRLTDQAQPYGPFDEWSQAAAFAAFLTAEVDPATIEKLRDPVQELLGWRASILNTAGVREAWQGAGSHGRP